MLTFDEDEELIYTEDTESNEECFTPDAQQIYDNWYDLFANEIKRLNRNK